MPWSAKRSGYQPVNTKASSQHAERILKALQGAGAGATAQVAEIGLKALLKIMALDEGNCERYVAKADTIAMEAVAQIECIVDLD